MISGKNFYLFQTLIGKTDKVLYYVKQTLFLKDALKEGIKLCVLGVFVAAVLCFPLHKAVLAGGDRSGF